MKTLRVIVRDKIATYMKRDGDIVCGNSDYQIGFDFDSEWDIYTEKVARFVWNGTYFDQTFTGNICPVPIIKNATTCFVGVHAGDLSTTTPAEIVCLRSILCQSSTPLPEGDAIYASQAQLSAEEARKSADKAEKAADKAAKDAVTAATATAEEEVARLVGEIGIAQELGTSPTATVSQAKVTREFEHQQSQITRNAKEIANLKAGIPDEDFHVDNTVAAVKDVPANALPYAEVLEVGGMTYKVNTGTEDTPVYELRSASATDIKSVGVNLYDGEDLNFVKEKIITLANPLTPGTYTITAYATSTDTDAEYNLITFFQDRNGKPNVFGSLRRGLRNSTTVTIEVPVSMIRFGASDNLAHGEGDTATFTEIMLNKGTTAQPYTPYRKHTLNIPEAVRPKHGINANVYDSITWDEDGKQRSRVKCGEVDMGTLSWKMNKVGLYYAAVPKMLAKYTKIGVLCGAYDYQGFGEIATMTTDKSCWSNNGYIWVHDSAYTDEASFKAAMSGVMLVYELVEPIITDISDLLPTDNLLGVEGGGTVTMVNEYGYDVPSTIVYQIESEVSV